MVLGGEDFEDFTTPSADDHIKLYVPSKAGDLAARDFTPRHFDAEAKKLTIDIALHSAGPAIRWAEQAQAGDVVEISGPRGSLMISDDFDWWLLIGDETALPSIGRRVEGLAAGVHAITLVAVAGVSGVNYFFGSATTISPYRVDSSLLLPNAARCLMKNVIHPHERDGWQIEEATEHDNETGTD
jgi:NADPH-dependent ferric siderophore reductase